MDGTGLSQDEGLILQFGMPPNRIDLIMVRRTILPPYIETYSNDLLKKHMLQAEQWLDMQTA